MSRQIRPGQLQENVLYNISTSFASTASYLSNYTPPFPFTGSAEITGSFNVTGPVNLTYENGTNLIIHTTNTYGEILFTGSGVSNITSKESDLRILAGAGKFIGLGADNVDSIFKIIEDGNANIKGGLRNVKIRSDEGYTLGLGADNVNDIILISSSNVTISGTNIIEDSNTGALLRVTQTGTGDAIRIEDSTNPDATPTVITKDGDMYIGSSSAISTAGGLTPKLYIKNGSSGYTGNLAIDTAMLFEGNGASYFATLSPDSAVSGLYMGSTSDIFGAFIRWGYDVGRLQLGAAQVGHGIEFTVGNKSATSMQLRPDASATGDYNATLTITGSVVATTGSFGRLEGLSPITVGDPVAFEQPITASAGIVLEGTMQTNFTTASIVYSGSNITQVTQSFGATQQITNITYSGSFADGNPLSISVTGSDGVNKLYTLTYSASLVTQIIQS